MHGYRLACWSRFMGRPHWTPTEIGVLVGNVDLKTEVSQVVRPAIVCLLKHLGAEIEVMS